MAPSAEEEASRKEAGTAANARSAVHVLDLHARKLTEAALSAGQATLPDSAGGAAGSPGKALDRAAAAAILSAARREMLSRARRAAAAGPFGAAGAAPAGGGTAPGCRAEEVAVDDTCAAVPHDGGDARGSGTWRISANVASGGAAAAAAAAAELAAFEALCRDVAARLTWHATGAGSFPGPRAEHGGSNVP